MMDYEIQKDSREKIQKKKNKKIMKNVGGNNRKTLKYQKEKKKRRKSIEKGYSRNRHQCLLKHSELR